MAFCPVVNMCQETIKLFLPLFIIHIHSAGLSFFLGCCQKTIPLLTGNNNPLDGFKIEAYWRSATCGRASELFRTPCAGRHETASLTSERVDLRDSTVRL